MKFRRDLSAFLVASTVLGGAAYAADQTSSAPAKQNPAAAATTSPESKQEKMVDRDIVRLSKDGMQALRDIQETRIAIFNAQPDEAKSLIGKAKDAMQKAGKDDTAFMKAASELGGPMSANAKTPAATTDQTKPVAWLPVDTQLTLGEGFQATPEKIAAVTDANKSLQSADRKGAIEKLKLADVDVQFATAVVPLDQTTNDVNKAADLIGQGKFYEANAALKEITDQVRVYVVDIDGQPVKAAAKTDPAPTAPAADTKPAAKSN